MDSKNAIRVLLVDDLEGFRNAATAILERRGFHIMAVAGGAEALEEIRKGDVDVVVLDIKMPEMDGHETFYRIKELQPGVEVIMLTGFGSEDSALEYMREGAFDYLTKPCDLDLLIDKIHQAYNRKRPHADAVQEKSLKRRR